jgi:hypothetical protein
MLRFCTVVAALEESFSDIAKAASKK